MRKIVFIILAVSFILVGCTEKYVYIEDMLIGDSSKFSTSFVTLNSIGANVVATSKVVYYNEQYYYIDKCAIYSGKELITSLNNKCITAFQYTENGIVVVLNNDYSNNHIELDSLDKRFKKINDLKSYLNLDILFISSDEVRMVDYETKGRIEFRYKIYDGGKILFPQFEIQTRYDIPDFIINNKKYIIRHDLGYLSVVDFDSKMIISKVRADHGKKLKSVGTNEENSIIVLSRENKDMQSSYDYIYFMNPDGVLNQTIGLSNRLNIINIIGDEMILIDKSGTIYKSDLLGENMMVVDKINEIDIDLLYSKYMNDYDENSIKLNKVIDVHNIKNYSFIYINDELFRIIDTRNMSLVDFS
ncbi:hypothetical protein [Anaerorhabdus furcosa]|uniref:Lipoprotein n=1 Tax=Anaerorhabdus furcosa TaxID=118967 RepID=A0A1T4PFS1_9FIRM|nr:hypothetical protein [Anaerorhabdus furcosa]SJZ89658.1 hypothetical protein SAMN02745191_1966 [Anaerorhabdus furcosa]